MTGPFSPPSSTRWLLVTAGAALLLVACRGKTSGEGNAAPSGAGGAAIHAQPAAIGPTKAPGQVTLELLPVRVGTRIQGRRKSAMKLSIEFWRDGEKLGTNELGRSEEYVRQVEVLGLLGRAPAKIRARYEKYHLSDITPEKPPRDDGSLSGRVFVLDATEGPLLSRGDHGEPVTADEKASLERLHGDLGQDDPVVTALGSRPIPVGQATPLRESLFLTLVSAESGNFKSGTITLVGTETYGKREAASFDWAAEMHTHDDAGPDIAWHLTGKLLVGVSPARLLRSVVKGALDVTGHTSQNGARVDLAGDGSFEDERTATPE